MSEETNSGLNFYFSLLTSKNYTITSNKILFALRWYKNILCHITYLRQLDQQISSLHFNNYTSNEFFSDSTLFARHVTRYNTLTKLFFETHKKFINYINTNGYTYLLESSHIRSFSSFYTHKITRYTPYIEINHVPPRTKHTHLDKRKPCRNKKRKFDNCDSLFTKQRKLLRCVKYARSIPNNFLLSLKLFSPIPTMNLIKSTPVFRSYDPTITHQPLYSSSNVEQHPRSFKIETKPDQEPH